MKINEYYSLLEQMNEGYALLEVTCSRSVIGYDYRFLRVNPAFEKMTGFKSEELVGKTFSYFWGNNGERCEDNLNEVFRFKTTKHFKEYSTALKKKFEITTFTPTSNQVACVFHEVTDFVNVKNNQSNEISKIDKSCTDKSKFISQMGHELRTSLNGVMGMLQLMVETPLNEEQSEFIGLAFSSTEKLNSLTSMLLDYSLLEYGAISLNLKSFELKKMLSLYEQSFQELSREKGAKFIINIDSSIPDELVGDEFRVQQILKAMISNTLKHSKGVVVRMDISVEAVVSHDYYIQFSISDNGFESSEEKCGKTFFPFEQGSTGLNPMKQGIELGLSFCKKLVQLMRGSLSVESNVSSGSVVNVNIPFQLSEVYFKNVSAIEGAIEHNVMSQQIASM